MSYLKLSVYMIVIQLTIAVNVMRSQWIKTSWPEREVIYNLKVDGTSIYAGTGRGVYLSNDEGNKWQRIKAPILVTEDMAIFDSTIVLGTSSGLFISTKNDTNWTHLIPDSTSLFVKSLLVLNDTNIIVGTAYESYLLEYIEKEWKAKISNIKNNYTTCFTKNGTDIYAGTSIGIFHSTGNGLKWESVKNGLPDTPYVSCLLSHNSNLFAGTHYGIFKSSDKGENWFLTDTNYVDDFKTYKNYIFAATNNGIMFSENDGLTWKFSNEGFPEKERFRSFIVYNSILFVGSLDGVWRRPLSEIVTSVEIKKEMYSDFKLEQNYPNPFNPTTTIKYKIPFQSNVVIKIYDIIGREIETLVDGLKLPGVYKIIFDGRKLASGVYFCRLIADTFIETKKIILSK